MLNFKPFFSLTSFTFMKGLFSSSSLSAIRVNYGMGFMHCTGDREQDHLQERCTHLNAVFQRIVRRDKKAFLCDQCKEIEENKEWEKLEISSRKVDTKGIFHAKMGTIKDGNDMDLTEAEDIKKR